MSSADHQLSPLIRWPLTSCKFRAVLIWSTVAILGHASAQTEGDTGYDYHDMFEDEYDSSLSDLGKEPSFDSPLANATVRVGEMAVLPCVIDHLGKYKVAWLEHNSFPLTFEDRRVIDDSRFSVVRPAVKEWNLQIQDVRLQDNGPYRCTVNIKPVISKTVWLSVTVPAAILDESSSRDKSVPEGDDVTFSCNVTGVPKPEVTWYRLLSPGRATETEAGACRYANISKGQLSREATTGAVWNLTRGRNSLTIVNVSRHCEDIYECHAFNGVSPEATRKMRLTVEFPPKISLPNRRIGQSRGKQTILECTITAFPQAVNYWHKDGRIVSSSAKHKIEAYDESEHALTLSLRIGDLEPSDYGFYNCVAANRLGRDEQTMQLYETLDLDSIKPTTFKPFKTSTGVRSAVGEGPWEGLGFSLAPQAVFDATAAKDSSEQDIYQVIGNSLASRIRGLANTASSLRPSTAICLTAAMTTASGTFTILANHGLR